MLTAQDVISLLNLSPHPEEGGYFREVYRSGESVTEQALPERYGEVTRVFGTSIYYMLTPDNFSSMHKLESDEIFHFYLGVPVEIILLYPDGTGRIVTLGNDIERGEKPMVVVPRGVWQGAKMKTVDDCAFCGMDPAYHFALMGTTVSPGFEYADFSHGSRETLLKQYPDFKDYILRLTKESDV